MKIILTPNDNNKIIDEYLAFNQIPFEKVDLYNLSLNRHDLTYLLAFDNPVLLIISTNEFNSICSSEQSKNQLINFCNRSNKLWLWNDLDATTQLIRSKHYINSGAITWFLDAPLIDNNFNNIKFEVFPNSYFLSPGVVPRITGSTVEKKNCQKQFLLTTIKNKHEKEHRAQLWKELASRPALLAQGHAFYKTLQDPWVGATPHQHDWGGGYLSMDLYLDAWLEVVPETLYKDAWFITEKTVKPIVTKTPFLSLSTPGYLTYLKEQGFQTFDSLIDESYNQQDNIEDQVKMLVDQLEFIVNNGAENFYHACADILEHNQQQLFEIAGGWQFHMDGFIHKQLQQLEIS